MPRRVMGPDGKVNVFPDDATDKDISDALEAIPATKAPPKSKARTWTDTVVDALPAAAATVGGVVGGIGGTVLGMGVGGAPGAIGGAALGGGAGEAAKQLINRARGEAAPATPGAAAADIAMSGAVQGGLQGVGEGLGAGMSYVAPKLMQSAVKPTLQMMKDHPAGRLVQTLLDDGVSVTQSGLDKLHGLLTATNAEIRSAIDGSTARIRSGDVADRLTDLSNRVVNQVNPTKDLKAVESAGEEFLNHPRLAGGRDMSVQTAQDMKVGTYQQLKGKYGEMSNASAEAQKALARGLKEEIAKEVPGIGALNERDSDLLAAIDAVGRRVAFSGNRDPIGFAWVTQHPTSFIAALMDKSPAVKSLLARGLYQSAAASAKVSPVLLRTALDAIATHEPAPDAQKD